MTPDHMALYLYFPRIALGFVVGHMGYSMVPVLNQSPAETPAGTRQAFFVETRLPRRWKPAPRKLSLPGTGRNQSALTTPRGEKPAGDGAR